MMLIKIRIIRNFDFSIIGGPHYSTDTKLGLGLVAAGLYRADRSDMLLPPVQCIFIWRCFHCWLLYVGEYAELISFRRTNTGWIILFIFDSFPSKVLGNRVRYGNVDANESDLDRWQAQIKASFLFRIADNLYIGPMASYDYVHGKNMERPGLLEGMNLTTANYGVGLSLAYDSRDVLTNPHKGYYLNITQCFRPKFLGNDYAFSTTDLRTSYYHPVWEGGLLAGELRGTFNFGNPSWAMMALLGNSYSMRGYYEGRYRDKHKIEGQVELRQHVWKRNGVVVWIGAGTVFNKFSALRMDRVLPNYGIGYRWEFKKNVNVRLDYGFGKNWTVWFYF